MESKTTSKIMTMIKVFFFVGLSTIAFNAYAGCGCKYHGTYHKYQYYCKSQGGIYYGNPNRPYTIWVNAGYDRYGCWHEGYYLKILGCVKCGDLVWVGDHWQVRPYRVVVVNK